MSGAPPTRPRVQLGATDVRVAPLAVGTWSWGERRYWGYDDGYGPSDVADAFVASADAGLDLFDTAEVYGDGESEKILGWLVRKRGGRLAVATKFGLLPGRDARTPPRALDASLRRLGLPQVDLYQIHWPDRSRASIAELMNGLANAVEAGKARAVGVSNFGANEMREAHAALARRARTPGRAARLEPGALQPSSPCPRGRRRARRVSGAERHAARLQPARAGHPHGQVHGGPGTIRSARRSRRVRDREPRRCGWLVEKVVEVGAAHGGARPEQIALAWLGREGRRSHRGAKTGEPATINAGALAVELAPDEIDAIDRVSERWQSTT
jgi:aryl-alcohol dehydrogenase-like predicted oxidoreductase